MIISGGIMMRKFKRTLIFGLSIVMVLSFTGCGGTLIDTTDAQKYQ